MRKNLVVGLLVAVISGAMPVRGDDPQGVSPTGFQQLMQEAVQRKMPPLVKTELERQIDEIVAPGQSGNRERVRIQSADSSLLTIRGQFELYKSQHRGNYPSLVDLADWEVLVKATDEQGHTEGQTTYGPYIANGPANPFTNSNTIVAAGTASVKDGWTWDEMKGCLRIVLPEREQNAIQYFGSDVEMVRWRVVPMTPAHAAISPPLKVAGLNGREGNEKKGHQGGETGRWRVELAGEASSGGGLGVPHSGQRRGSSVL